MRRISKTWLYIVFFAPLAFFYEPVKSTLVVDGCFSYVQSVTCAFASRWPIYWEGLTGNGKRIVDGDNGTRRPALLLTSVGSVCARCGQFASNGRLAGRHNTPGARTPAAQARCLSFSSLRTASATSFLNRTSAA